MFRIRAEAGWNPESIILIPLTRHGCRPFSCNTQITLIDRCLGEIRQMCHKLDVVSLRSGNSGLSRSEQQPHMRSRMTFFQRLPSCLFKSHCSQWISWVGNVNELGGRGGQDNVRFVWPECINTKRFETGRPPRELPISLWLPELSSPGPLSICAKFIRLPSVCAAIMAAPSCCSSKGAHRLQSLAQTLQRRVSVLSYWLWLTAPLLKRPVTLSQL